MLDVQITSHKRYFTVVLMAYFYILKNEYKIKISKGVDEDKRINELFINYGNKYSPILIDINLNFYKYLNNFRKNHDENMKETIYK